MPSKVSISELQLQQLGTASLALVAKFAYALKAHNGNVINLRGEYALRSVVDQAKRSDSAELRQIYAELKRALKVHLNSKQDGKLRPLGTLVNQTKLDNSR
jgi:hypothetical protein